MNVRSHARHARNGRRGTAALLVVGTVLAGIGTTALPAAAASCVTVDIASSPEKLELLTDLANRFGRSAAAEVGGRCVTVRVTKASSGAAATLLAASWPKPAKNGPRPVIWSPAASTWGAVLDQRRAEDGKDPYVTTPGTSFMLTPLVIAMPQPMAAALDYPATPIGFSDVLALSQDPEGWAGKGHPEWGPFRLGKTNPNFSTSGLAQTVAQYYAATGKTTDLTLEDLARPEVDAFARGVESAVVHYGDTTLTFLNNLYRADRRGDPYGYASAVAVEEKSVVDYNRGNPDGILDPGEQPRKPRVPLVAIYPKEGTLFSDNPLIVLDAPWVSKAEATAARAFANFVTSAKNQRQVLEYGFRPGNPAVSIGKPITAANGLDPAQPQTTLEVPKPAVLAGVIDQWNQVRKKARVLLVVDVSGSMGDEADPKTGATKLDLAKTAAIAALDQFQPEDEVGLRIFSTEISNRAPTDYRDLVPIGPISANKPDLEREIEGLRPTQGTPLYTAAEDSYTFMRDGFDATRINAVVLLTDGRNEDARNEDLAGLLSALRTTTEGESTSPVRIFTIAYGNDADESTLKRIAEATNAAAYSAVDPATIVNVFNAVVSNF
ncbi:MAG TPA: extracellular solute-binding protein [Acidimicrobiia bacterium]|nr:extracellular solute-binding protein [Acidimicrobiia bacterium]